MPIDYAIKCPECAAKATAKMRESGIKGTYREVTVRTEVHRIVCHACGLLMEVPEGKAENYELWYAKTFRGHRVWAVNQEHLEFLIAWLSGTVAESDLTIADRAMVECLPKWMVAAKNRPGVLKCLRQMSSRDSGESGE